jgi:hypothetical protein
MKRLLLPLVTALLVLLVVADRIGRVWSTAVSNRTPNASHAASAPSAVRIDPDTTPSPPPPPATSAASRTPTLDRLARLAIRQQLNRLSAETYLDSLMATTDSVVRRWPDRGGEALKVAIIEGGVADYSPRFARLVRQALARWSDGGVGVRFIEVTDTAGADILVRWIDRFEFDRAGQTDLTWDQLGRVRRALISLALKTNTGVALADPALLAVAVHETGHAIGLPHSADSNDVMFPSTHTSALSERDLRTAAMLYELPPGSVRDVAAP